MRFRKSKALPHEMFKLMALFAPIAGMMMLIARYLMFRDLFLSITIVFHRVIQNLGFPLYPIT
jgi:hypothetical protein